MQRMMQMLLSGLPLPKDDTPTMFQADLETFLLLTMLYMTVSYR